MNTTSEIRILKLESRRTNIRVTISGLEKPLLMPDAVGYELRLVEGIVLTESQLERLQLEADRLACYRSAGRMLGMRACSKGQLRMKLKRKEFPPQVIAETITKYEKMGAVDDFQFATRTAERLLEQRPCGRSYLMGYLERRMIDRSVSEQVAATLLREVDETEQAIEALKARERRLSELNLEDARTKAYNYLSRRGFGYAASRAAFEQLIERSRQENEN